MWGLSDLTSKNTSKYNQRGQKAMEGGPGEDRKFTFPSDRPVGIHIPYAYPILSDLHKVPRGLGLAEDFCFWIHSAHSLPALWSDGRSPTLCPYTVLFSWDRLVNTSSLSPTVCPGLVCCGWARLVGYPGYPWAGCIGVWASLSTPAVCCD